MTKKGIAMVELTELPPDKVYRDKERYCNGRDVKVNITSPQIKFLMTKKGIAMV